MGRWPTILSYVALGWFEAGLASRVRLGDGRAARRARLLLHGQAVAFASASSGAAALAWWHRDGSGHLTLTWLPLLIAAGAHAAVARAVGAAPATTG